MKRKTKQRQLPQSVVLRQLGLVVDQELAEEQPVVVRAIVKALKRYENGELQDVHGVHEDEPPQT